ncbi:MAG: hypothetical protein JJU15_19725 [Pararhodobacter sp.]|nr:hypothetical protein [Pararhodobacter sp.]
MEPRRLYVLTKARSGSNQFAAYVNQVPGCRCYGEVFKKNYPANRDLWKGMVKRFPNADDAVFLHKTDLCAFWDTFVASHTGETDIVGARVFYHHRRSDPLWSQRIFSPDSLIVHLWRDSIFASYVSTIRAKASGEWLKRKDSEQSDSDSRTPREAAGGELLEFDVVEYQAYRRSALRWFRRTEALLADHPNVLSVEYSEIAQPERLAVRLGEFLGKAVALQETYQKTTTRPPISYLANPEDAREFVDDRLSKPRARAGSQP